MLQLPDQNAIESCFLPEVSVIIPIYNGAKELAQLKECIQAQSYPAAKVEYLLVDNNSCDRTLTLLDTLSQELAATGINLHPLSENRIQSSYAARNLGIKASQAEILAFTDADCRPEPHWLQELVQPFSKPEIGIVAGEIVGLEGNTILEQYAAKYGVLSAKFSLEHTFRPYGQTANLAIRKQAFREVGLFRPHLTTGGDADICWRILGETNWKIDYRPEAMIKHRHRATIKELRSQWRRYGCSNHYLHELYDVALMRELQPQEFRYRILRWLFKEIPVNIAKIMLNKADILDLIRTPIDLICFQARTQGQQNSQLEQLARQIEYF